jgi:hypothetical protein
LIRGLGEDHVDFLTGAAAMISMGMAVYYMKGLSGNFEVSDNPGVWIAEGIDRSGVLSVPMEINNMLEGELNRAGLGGVYTGLAHAFGDGGALSSRYRFKRDFLGSAILGPTASTVNDVRKVTGAALAETVATGKAALGVDSDQEVGDAITSGTVGSAGRLLPFANHPGVKQFMRYFAIPEAKEWAEG